MVDTPKGWRLALLYAPLILAASVHLVPEVMPGLVGGRPAAWAYIMYGIEAAALWAFVFYIIWQLRVSTVATIIPLAASAWSFIEGSQRAVCMSLLPMDKPVRLNGQPICDVVFGWPVSWAGIAAALLISIVAQELMKCRTP